MKKVRTIGLGTLGFLLLTTACEKKVDLASDKGKASYAIGHQIGKNMKYQGLKLDVDAFAIAIRDAMEDKKPRLEEGQMREAMRKMNEDRRKASTEEMVKNSVIGQKFLDENKTKEGVEVTTSGLQYKVITEGKGAKPTASDTVKVHYRGTLINGTEFDSSIARNEPAKFPVSAVIPGWTEALQLMPVGSKWELYVPSHLAYGERGNPNIPANSVLIFEVELLDIERSE